MEQERSASRLSLESAEKAEEALAHKQDSVNSALAQANAEVEAANNRVQVKLDPHLFTTLSHLFGTPPLPSGTSHATQRPTIADPS